MLTAVSLRTRNDICSRQSCVRTMLVSVKR